VLCIRFFSGTAATWVVSALPTQWRWRPVAVQWYLDFSHCEIKFVGVGNVEVKRALSTDPNPKVYAILPGRPAVWRRRGRKYPDHIL